jgi:hypothetical protein
MGGSDDPSNLIELSVEEHAEAHRVLFEKYGKKEDELAWKGLLKLINKEEMVKQLSSLCGKKWKGKKHKTETLEKMSLVHKGNQYCKGIPKTDEHKNKLSKAKLKKWKIITPEGKEMIIENLPLFCKENNLLHSKMVYIKKTGYLHKGFYCEKVL